MASNGAEAAVKEQKKLDESLIVSVFAQFDECQARNAITAGANVDASDKNATTALMFACVGGSLPAASLLISKGADADLEDRKNGRAALHYAAEAGFSDIVRLLLSKGRCNLDAVDRREDTGLHLAARGGHADTVDALLEALRGRGRRAQSASLERQNARGLSPLAEAALFGRAVCVEKLLQAGASPDALVGPRRLTALHLAAGRGHVECVRALLAAGADLTIRSEDDLTALEGAEKLGHTEAAALLRQAADRRAQQQQPPSTPSTPLGAALTSSPAPHRTSSLEAADSPTASCVSNSLPPATPLAIDDSPPPESRARVAPPTPEFTGEGKDEEDEIAERSPSFHLAAPRTTGTDVAVDPDSDRDEESDGLEKQRAKHARFLQLFVAVMLAVFAFRVFLFIEDSEAIELDTRLGVVLTVLGYIASLKVANWYIKGQQGSAAMAPLRPLGDPSGAKEEVGVQAQSPSVKKEN